MKAKGQPIDILSTPLPGIGVCQELRLRSGRRIGVVIRRDGLTDLVVYDDLDPDAVTDRVELTTEEANAIAEILGAPQLVEHLTAQQEQAFGLRVEQLPVPPGSPFAGRTLGDTQTRTRTGASIVAVIRHGNATPSPGPAFNLAANDLVVVVGTREAIDQVAAILGAGGD